MHVIEGKLQRLLSSIEKVKPELRFQCEVEYREDDSALVYGPFPSFLILVEQFGPVRVLVHVNADAPNLVWVFDQLKYQIDNDHDISLAIDGPFAVDGDSGNLILGQAAYKKKEDNILMFAKDILARRQEHKQEGILMPEKKIILAS